MTTAANESFAYPILRASDGLDYLDRMKQQWTPGSTPETAIPRPQQLTTTGVCSAPFDATVLRDLRSELKALASQFPADVSNVRVARNQFDLEASKVVFARLRQLPLSVLFDKDFWRYLAVEVLFEVLIWRVPDSGTSGWPSNFGVGSNWTRCYPYKAYLRGQLIERVHALGYEWTDIQDVDFYDSHLFGRRNGLIPSVASALNTIRATLSNSRALDPYATTATRYRAVHVTEVLDPAEAEAMIRRYTKPSGPAETGGTAT